MLDARTISRVDSATLPALCNLTGFGGSHAYARNAVLLLLRARARRLDERFQTARADSHLLAVQH